MGIGLAGTILVIVVALLVAAGGVMLAIGIYNSLIEVRSNIEKAWKNIDVLLQQRHDEILKLIDACKGYMKYERDVLDSLTRLRADYGKAGSIAEKTKLENEMNRSFARLKVSLEAYPDLKTSQNVLQLQQRVSALESSIADRRELFNDSVNIYNIQIRQFPSLLFAGPLGYRRHEFLEVAEDLKKDVKVDLS